MARLEQIVAEIDSEELGLEKQFELFKEGMGLARFCDAKLTELLRRYSEAFDAATQKDLAGQIQAEFHSNVNYVLAGQFSAPRAYRSNLKGVVPFGFPAFWNIERK